MIIITNPDENFVRNMKRRIKSNNGYCPNSLYKSPDQKCPCMDFKLKDTPGPCSCGLYFKQEDAIDAK